MRVLGTPKKENMRPTLTIQPPIVFTDTSYIHATTMGNVKVIVVVLDKVAVQLISSSVVLDFYHCSPKFRSIHW